MAIDYSRRHVYKGVTKGQFEAITEAMKLLAEEDQERGMDAALQIACQGCGESRGRIGSVEYDGIRLCNRCATDFEVARISHAAGSCDEYVAKRRAGRN